MSKTRLEAFSDGVIAILITIMILELRPPHDTTWRSLATLLPTFLSYLLSFVMLGIYWNNHHHTLHATNHVNGAVLWGNQHLLFWLSLIPFATSWMGEDHAAPLPTCIYGCVMIGCAMSYNLLVQLLIRADGSNSRLNAAVTKDYKGVLSGTMYTAAVPLAYVHTSLSHALFLGVAALWFVPDRRIEKLLNQSDA